MSDYNKSKEAQEVFKNKTKPKTPIKFGISLNEEQKEGKKIILDNTDDSLKKQIQDSLKEVDNFIFINYVSPNKVNRVQTKKVLLQVSNVIKTFEGFNWKKN